MNDITGVPHVWDCPCEMDYAHAFISDCHRFDVQSPS